MKPRSSSRAVTKKGADPSTLYVGRDRQRRPRTGLAVAQRRIAAGESRLLVSAESSQPSITLCTFAAIGSPNSTPSPVRIGMSVAPNASNSS